MKILYFAWMREKIGLGEEELTPPDFVQTVQQMADWLRGRSPGHAAAFAHAKLVRCAIDQEFVKTDAVLGAAREIAFFPPVTGG
jgi:molybdopterin synthase sulfur carrier subunit